MIGNPNTVPATFAGVRQSQLTLLGNSDPTDVPLNFRIGGGSCFINFPNGPAAIIPAGGACTLNFTYTTAIDEPENDNSGTSRLRFVTAFAEDVSGTLTSAFGFITVQDPPPVPVPEPSTLILVGTGLLGLKLIQRQRHARTGGTVPPPAS